jgi:hypothetical protein
MSKRNDIHRPGAIVPRDYDYVMSYSLPSTCGGDPVPAVNLDEVRVLMAHEKFAPTGDVGKCSVCGAWFIYGDIWVHENGEHIHLGQDCAFKYGLQKDRSDFELKLERARRAAGVAAAKIRNSAERLRFLAEHPGLDKALETDHRIVRDIAERFIQYRSLSEKQIALVFKLAGEERDRQLHEANHSAEERVEGCMFCEREASEERRNRVSNYVGEVGKRMKLALHIEKVIEMDGDYGKNYLHIFTDEAGNSFKWFASTRLWAVDQFGKIDYRQENRLDAGAKVVVMATIKKHEEYKGKKQTALSRVAVHVEIEKPKKNKANKEIAAGIVAFMNFAVGDAIRADGVVAAFEALRAACEQWEREVGYAINDMNRALVQFCYDKDDQIARGICYFIAWARGDKYQPYCYHGSSYALAEAQRQKYAAEQSAHSTL